MSYHNRDNCPAHDAICHRCKNKGHYQPQCKTKNIRTILTDSAVDPDDELYIASVNQHTSNNPWVAEIDVNGIPVKFKIDTGADVSVLPESTFGKLSDVILQPSSKSLAGPSRQALQVCGQFKAICSYGDKQAEEDIFVVKDLQMALLGRPAIEALHLYHAFRSSRNRQILLNSIRTYFKVWERWRVSTTSNSKMMPHRFHNPLQGE